MSMTEEERTNRVEWLRNRQALEEVIRDYQEESPGPRDQEIYYCFERFRRALEDHDQAAWCAIERQYMSFVIKWTMARVPMPCDVETVALEALANAGGCSPADESRSRNTSITPARS